MAGLMPIIFECTSDIGIPSYGATILEPGASGSYAGHGCHRDQRVAIERALLESAQSRCVYIAGARDDLMRRNFITMKGMSQDGLKDMYNSLPSTDVHTDTVDTSDEIAYILQKLKDKGFNKVFRKVLHTGTLNNQDFAVVRIFVPGLEVPQFDSWYPSKRCYGRTGN
jgi:YcaO-like protein with predicted kinase domain